MSKEFLDMLVDSFEGLTVAEALKRYEELKNTLPGMAGGSDEK